MKTTTKRAYRRRTEDEKIAELRERIDELKRRLEDKQRKDGPVQKELKKVRKALSRFSHLAAEHERMDLSTMTEAFLAGLERAAAQPPEEAGRRGRAGRA